MASTSNKRGYYAERNENEDASLVVSSRGTAENGDESSPRKKSVKLDDSQLCPFLDTINRNILDFDFEKLCSVSLSKINVYACLICGKYFQGRGTTTHGYIHSVSDDHHVFLNLHTMKFYCLPDNYEIVDSSLDDIKHVLNPLFTEEEIKQVDFCDKPSRTIDGTPYWPGIMGLNNIKANDYCNVVLQAFAHIKPIRDYFLLERNYENVRRPPGDSTYLLVQRFGELMRKLWNPNSFKAHVSPHEMLQAVVSWSNKRFQFTTQGDPVDFIAWFMNALHMALNGTKNINSSIIYKTFMGKLRVHMRKIPPVEVDEEEKNKLLASPEYVETTTESPFLYLTCDLPPPPLFKDEVLENIIPQVSLTSLMEKFNNKTEIEYKTYKDNFMKRFEIRKLPPYLIIYIKRFTKNTFFMEKNRTVINFPIKNVDFGEFLTDEIKAKHKNTVYNLVANIVHDGTPEKGTYRMHVLHKATGKWYEMQDLHVVSILPQMITLSEAYMQIYELKQEQK